MNRKKEFFFAVSATLISLALLLTSFTYPTESSEFPRFLTGLMLLFSLLMLVKNLRLKKEQKGQETPNNADVALFGKLKVPVIVFSVTIAYVVGIVYLGYFTSSVIFLIGTMSLFGKEKFLVKTVATAGFLLIVFALFVNFLGLRLPQGLLF